MEDTSMSKQDTQHSDSPEASRYHYEALQGRDKIRVIHLQPTKLRLECSLHQISHSESGYQALPYVWGSNETPFKAFVVDKDGNDLGNISLTQNLKSALSDPRQAYQIKSKMFWIDQLCINQEGDEKSSQVAMMGQIYQDASRVITYMGRVDYEEQVEIDLLQLLDQHFCNSYEIIYQSGSLAEAWRMKSQLPVLNLPEDIRGMSTDDDEDGLMLGEAYEGFHPDEVDYDIELI